jgi:GH25 family lysozyme M1 (1,4-beta-N-acetylmuramidase)
MGAFVSTCTRLCAWTARISVARTAAVAAGAAALVAGVLVIPSGATDLPAGSADHYAGSQIAKHEGVGRTSGEVPDGAVPGMDVSSHQGEVDWSQSWNDGARFAYVKATEGTGYLSPTFEQQYVGSHDIGMIRGAYHFALPDRSDGATQADFFIDNGGAWSADGRTMPPALDVEYNPYGEDCYGLDQAGMTAWIKSFSDQVFARTGRHPMIYTSTNWWNKCVGGSGDFSSTNPLWIARYAEAIGELPAGWGFHTIWQWQAAGLFPGDQNVFNGDQEQLNRMALG